MSAWNGTLHEYTFWSKPGYDTRHIELGCYVLDAEGDVAFEKSFSLTTDVWFRLGDNGRNQLKRNLLKQCNRMRGLPERTYVDEIVDEIP